MTRTEEKRQEKLNRVLRAASELFAISEYHQVGMDAIARDAGVGKGTLYNLFESKDDLYFSIIRMRLEELLADLEDACDGRDQPIEYIRSFLKHLCVFMSEHHFFYMIWKREERGINGSDYHREITLLQRRVDNLILAVLRRGESNGALITGLDHRLLTRVFFGLVDALIQASPGLHEIDGKIDAMLQMLIEGIGAGTGIRNESNSTLVADTLPLSGRRIVVTRSRKQSRGLASDLEALGAEIVEIPTIEIQPPDSYEEIDDKLFHLSDYDWIIFTSQNGVISFIERLREINLDASSYSRSKFAVVGNATADELSSHGIRPDLTSRKGNSEDLLKTLDSGHIDLEGKRVLFPCSDLSRDTVVRGIDERGGSIDRLVIYRTIEPEVPPPALASEFDPLPDLVTFTSPSTVRNYRRLLSRHGYAVAIREIPGISIGPVTTKAALDEGIEIAAEASEASVRSMVESIQDHFSRRKAIDEA